MYNKGFGLNHENSRILNRDSMIKIITEETKEKGEKGWHNKRVHKIVSKYIYIHINNNIKSNDFRILIFSNKLTSIIFGFDL